MEVILDELTPLEFFNHGGIVKISITDEDFIKEYKLKKKYTFFEYKPYVRFFRDLYMAYSHNQQDEIKYDSYKEVNGKITLLPSIGNSEYVVDLAYDGVQSYEFAKFYYYRDKHDINVEPRDPYGIPNVCFSLISETDDRWDKFAKQRLERGFDNSELWNLDGTIAKFIYPRIKLFYEDAKVGQYCPDGVPREEWLEDLGKIVEGFRLITLDRVKTEQEEALECEALDLFSAYFFTLWN